MPIQVTVSPMTSSEPAPAALSYIIPAPHILKTLAFALSFVTASSDMDRSLHTANQIPFSPLRHTFNDDYESGMEASASSMASGGEEDDFDEEEEDTQTDQEETRKRFQERQRSAMNHTKANNNKFVSRYHRRMSSGNSSTDSNATTRPVVKAPTSISTAANTNAAAARFHTPLPVINRTTNERIAVASRAEEAPTPTSGYDGDTEGPLVDEINRIGSSSSSSYPVV